MAKKQEEPQLIPPLKWAGGKRWLIPTLKEAIQNVAFKRLVEPFAGGLAVALALQPKSALLNDANIHLINFYQQIKKGLTIDQTFLNDREFYFNTRDQFNLFVKDEKQNSKESAQLFYYLNRSCFNGLCRFNNSGFFNVPFGQYKNINYKTDFFEYKNIFNKWEFTTGDFQKMVISPDDLIYVDPPYDVEFTKYSKDDFTWSDQVRLVEWLNKLDTPIVASNQATERILDLYSSSGFNIKTLPAPRRISCTGDRSDALEMFAWKGF